MWATKIRGVSKSKLAADKEYLLDHYLDVCLEDHPSRWGSSMRHRSSVVEVCLERPVVPECRQNKALLWLQFLGSISCARKKLGFYWQSLNSGSANRILLDPLVISHAAQKPSAAAHAQDPQYS